MLLKLLQCEEKKLKRTGLLTMSILIPIVINILLTLDLHYRYTVYLLVHQQEMQLSCWQLIFKEQRILYFNQLLPFFATLILIHIFSRESKNNGWTLILTQPINKFYIIVSKYIVACKYIVIMIVSDIVSIVISGIVTGVKEPVEIGLFVRCFFVLFFSTMAAAIIQLIILQVYNKKSIALCIAAFLAGISQNTYSHSIIAKVNPFAFVDHAYKASWQETICIFLISIVFIIVGMKICTLIFNKKSIDRL